MTRAPRQMHALLLGVLLGVTGCGDSKVGASNTPSDLQATVVQIETKKFTFVPETIQAQLGQPLLFEIQTKDVVHGFSLPDFALRADIIPGKTSSLRLTPDKLGTFRFFCDVFCGDGHDAMSGQFVVVE